MVGTIYTATVVMSGYTATSNNGGTIYMATVGMSDYRLTKGAKHIVRESLTTKGRMIVGGKTTKLQRTTRQNIKSALKTKKATTVKKARKAKGAKHIAAKTRGESEAHAKNAPKAKKPMRLTKVSNKKSAEGVKGSSTKGARSTDEMTPWRAD